MVRAAPRAPREAKRNEDRIVAFDPPRGRFSASIVVFLVAVPLCLGIALASGAPLFSVIIAGIVGGIVVGAASGSALGALARRQASR